MTASAPACGLPPMHPGELLRKDVIPALGLPLVEIARLLGVSRQALHAILSERAAVSPPMALKLGKLYGNGPDLWISRKRSSVALLPLGRTDVLGRPGYGLFELSLWMTLSTTRRVSSGGLSC